MCSNFYTVSGVRRIKGFKRYQRENRRTGTRYLEDIKNEDCHLFARVGLEDGGSASDVLGEAAHGSRDGAHPSLMELLELHQCVALTEKLLSPPFSCSCGGQEALHRDGFKKVRGERDQNDVLLVRPDRRVQSSERAGRPEQR